LRIWIIVDDDEAARGDDFRMDVKRDRTSGTKVHFGDFVAADES
jgi:hypothetical protein